MSRHIRSAVLICLVASASATLSAQDYVKTLQVYLKKGNLNLVNPASSDLVPGGLVVSDGKTASYNPLPPGVSFTPSSPAQESFYQDTVGKNFSLAALLAGIGSVLHAGLSVNHSNTVTINQIDATAQSVDGQSVVDNVEVAKRIKTWITPNDKTPKYKVYVLIKTFSSKTISVSDSSSLDVAGAFGTDVPACQNASTNSGSSGGSSGSSGGSAQGTAGAANSTAGATGGKGSANQQKTGKTPSAAPVAKPTASLKFCWNSNSKVSLNAASPLIFAAVLRAVTFDPQGQSLVVGPISVVVKSAQVTSLAEPEPIAIRKSITKPIFAPSSN